MYPTPDSKATIDYLFITITFFIDHEFNEQ